MTGVVTDIQRFSLHDGPGIRTTVFLKGCNLRCGWCHNPETLRPGPELQLIPDKCIGCGACLEACPHGAQVMEDGRRAFRRELCRACGSCAEVCYAEALVLVGREMTVDEVLREVLRDRLYYANSGGGLTISGGEPLCQHDFTLALLRRARDEGLHTAVETNADWPWEQLASLLGVTDLVMMDIKTMDPAAHRKWTGASNERVLDNARRLAADGVDLVVRTPVVPGVNDTPGEIARVADFLRDLANVRYYELLPYHPLGAGKYESLGMEYAFADVRRPPAETLHALADEARRRGLRVRVAGDARPGASSPQARYEPDTKG